MERWRELKEKWKSDKKLRILLLVFGVGLALLVLTGGGEKKGTAPSEDLYEVRWAVEAALEKRVASLLSSVEGVGRVKVLVTVERLQSFSYAQDVSSSGASDRTENDYVIVEVNGEKTGLALSVASPVVRGVAVSCEGGGSARVRQEVSSLVCAALGVNASRVYVSKLN